MLQKIAALNCIWIHLLGQASQCDSNKGLRKRKGIEIVPFSHFTSVHLPSGEDTDAVFKNEGPCHILH